MTTKKQVVGNSMVPADACIVRGYVAVACPSFIYSLNYRLLLLTASVSQLEQVSR